jgi:hypothetical protein
MVAAWEYRHRPQGGSMTSTSTSTPSFASERVPESSYTASLNAHETSSPQHPSSHDEYNRSLDNGLPKAPPLISAGASSASEVYTISSDRSSLKISPKTREELIKLYKSPVPRSLVTRMSFPTVCHIVPRSTESERVW